MRHSILDGHRVGKQLDELHLSTARKMMIPLKKRINIDQTRRYIEINHVPGSGTDGLEFELATAIGTISVSVEKASVQ